MFTLININIKRYFTIDGVNGFNYLIFNYACTIVG